MKQRASQMLLAFSLFLLLTVIPLCEALATPPPGPPTSNNAPLPAIWVLAAGGIALGVHQVRSRKKTTD